MVTLFKTQRPARPVALVRGSSRSQSASGGLLLVSLESIRSGNAWQQFDRRGIPRSTGSKAGCVLKTEELVECRGTGNGLLLFMSSPSGLRAFLFPTAGGFGKWH